MSDKPRVQMNFNAPVTGAAGNVEGDFIVNAAHSEFAEAIATFQKFLFDLQQKHPTATETEVPLLMKAELESMEQCQPSQWAILRRDLLNRERWFQGGKAAVTEVTKHFTENNAFAKGAIAFLEAFSETVEKYER
jgi:internalin A